MDWNFKCLVMVALIIRSHPSWVCGLKLTRIKINLLKLSHTLRGCVDWNSARMLSSKKAKVTPFVGVWIETRRVVSDNHQETKSHPSWVCGLKLFLHCITDVRRWSHPSWVCGLKLYAITALAAQLGSHPSWVCGLKLGWYKIFGWILRSHPSWVCGLKR